MKARIPDRALAALALVIAALAAGCHGARGEELAPETAPAGADAAGAAAADEIAHYTCSMHPSVRNPGPGSCPMCSMALAPVFRRELDSGEIVLDAGRRQQIGVTTARVERRPLAGPVRAAGMVTVDQSRLTDVSLRVGGWIDELFADRIGEWVKEGEPLFTLYSPDLFDAQQGYAAALEKLDNARKLRSPLIDGLAIETRRLRLRLSDLSPDQLEDLEKRRLPVERMPILSPASGHVMEKNVVAGAAVSPGMRLLRIAGLDRVWVEADVYESELPTLEVGDRATVTLRYLPGREFRGRISFIYPWLDPATRTGRVRVELPNPGLALKPEMYAEVVFERDLGERLAVPQGAVLYAGDRDYVFLDLGEGRLRPQAVTVGGRAGDWVEVLDGVEEGDVVVTSGNFLVAAEARLGLALEHWGGRRNGEDGPADAHDHSHRHAAHGNSTGTATPAAQAHGHAGHRHGADSARAASGGHQGHRDAAPRAATNGAGGEHDHHAAPAGRQAHDASPSPPPADGGGHGHAPPSSPADGPGGAHGGHAHGASSSPAPSDEDAAHDHGAASSPPADGGPEDHHAGHAAAAPPAAPPPPPPAAHEVHDRPSPDGDGGSPR